MLEINFVHKYVKTVQIDHNNQNRHPKLIYCLLQNADTTSELPGKQHPAALSWTSYFRKGEQNNHKQRALGVVVERGLLLGLHLQNAVHEVLVHHFGRVAPQRDHALRRKPRQKLGGAPGAPLLTASTHTALHWAPLNSSMQRDSSPKFTSGLKARGFSESTKIHRKWCHCSVILREWICRMRARASSVGNGSSTLRSRRPLRSSAGSRMSTRFVAAITLMSALGWKPSSWFSSSSMVRCTSRSPAFSESNRFVPGRGRDRSLGKAGHVAHLSRPTRRWRWCRAPSPWPGRTRRAPAWRRRR